MDSSSSSGLKILLIDDVEAFGPLLGAMIKNRARVFQATTLEAAELAIELHKDADVFIVDGCLTHGHRLDTIPLVRQIKENNPSATIIVRTSHTNVDELYTKAGADYVLEKSGTPNLTRLLTTLHAHLDGAEAMKAAALHPQSPASSLRTLLPDPVNVKPVLDSRSPE